FKQVISGINWFISFLLKSQQGNIGKKLLMSCGRSLILLCSPTRMHPMKKSGCRVEWYLLEFFPPGKRSAEAFSEHFTKAGMIPLVEYNDKKIFEVKTWAKLLNTFCTNGKLELELLYKVQIQCYEDTKLMKLFPQIVRSLYDQDVLAKDTILHEWKLIQTSSSKTTNAYGTSTTLIPGPVTTEKKVQKKNDVKARSMLLMALPNEHLMTFNQYKDAKTFFAAIQTRFGGNEATKKTQKTLLKQIYENFSAPSTESLDSIFNRLQKIVSQLAILGENISQEDLNLKFLRSLPSEWNTHVVVWRNKHNLDTISFDDLYNNFKIVKQEVKGIASSSSSYQNMAFVSSPSSINEFNTAYGVITANTHVSPASTQVSTANTQVSTANLSDDTVYAFLANQPNGSRLVYEDLEQIHKDDIEEMDLKWQLALLSMSTRRFFQKTNRKITINGSHTAGYDKSNVKCFNCHKMGHFARERRGHRNQDSRNRNQDSSRRTVNVEETSKKGLVMVSSALSHFWLSVSGFVKSREPRPPPPEGPPVVIEPLRIEYPFQEDPTVEPMADTRTMAQLLQAPTEGYEDAILIPEIVANNFELKHGLINLVQNKQFFRS
ncbi:ribonuclease H-like domain-containing protein, partial [Tanacetum coccineum]